MAYGESVADRIRKGMVYVGVDGFKTKASLARWVERGLAFARSMPPK